MNITHIQKNMGVPPRKLRLVADMVRKMTPQKALEVLEFTPKAAAKPLSKAIKTALANGRNLNLDSDLLTFKTLEVNEGFRMKRMRAAGRMRRQPYDRETSQIRIILTDENKEGDQHGSKN